MITKNIHRTNDNFHFLTANFCATLLMLSLAEVLILTLTIFGGLK